MHVSDVFNASLNKLAETGVHEANLIGFMSFGSKHMAAGLHRLWPLITVDKHGLAQPK